ncbi:DNA-directed RNA polymerase subunit beta', partial [Candidatus Dojkabacteria bacterium]|nr:DNA-directed RNA polymerase subunit beta' [Candidatus Dojkabacteria bacterium]
MAVHVPLSKRAVEEARTKMMAKQNILLLADSTPVVSPDMDMVLGCYYLTGIEADSKDLTKERVFGNESELLSSYESHQIGLRDLVTYRLNGEMIKTTTGRVMFNALLPEGFEFLNEQVDKTKIKKIIAKCLNKYDEDTVATTLDNLKETGFKYATLSGFSVGMDDLVMHPGREGVIKEAEAKDEELMGSYYSGLITQTEMKKLSQQNWLEVTDRIADMTWSSYGTDNPLYQIEVSGARAVKNPTRQISGIRGLILDAQGKIVDLPLKSNFKLGLNSFEYFVGSKSTRKGLADTALKTAESGYLTRRLVDVGQDLITTEEDCGVTDKGMIIRKSDERRLSFEERIFGRWTAEAIKDPKTGKTIVGQNEEITPDLAEVIANSDVEEVRLRSPLTCSLQYGICTKCYGYDLGKQKLVEEGVAVGVIAAQAMGEA